MNDITDPELSQYVDEFKACVTDGKYARNGYGIQPLLRDVGLDECATEATAMVRAEIAHDEHKHKDCVHTHNEEKKDDDVVPERSVSYQDWIKESQADRNATWKFNVDFEKAADTPHAPRFLHHTLFHKHAEEYATSQTTVVSNNIKGAAKGTFTGMSAIAFAEGSLSAGQAAEVHTLESDDTTARAATKIFGSCEEKVKNSIHLHHGDAINWMSNCAESDGVTFDIIFIDADKDNYFQYYSLAMGDTGLRPLLAEGGCILADNTLSALVYDEDDSRREALHLFNQHVKNDARVEEAVLTLREGVTIISRV